MDSWTDSRGRNPNVTPPLELTKMTPKELFEKHKPIVERIVAGFLKKLPRNVSRDDLLNAGLLGLWEALCKQTSHENLDAYLHIRVRGAIIDELRTQDWIPRRLRDQIDAEEACMGIVRLEDMSIHDRNIALTVDIEESVSRSREIQILVSVLERLPSRERYILESHYLKGVKFVDLAKEMCVSEPRISQLHSRALEWVKEMVAA